MKLQEQLKRINNLISELSPASEGIKEFLDLTYDFPELIKHLGYTSYSDLKQDVLAADFEEFDTLRKELEYFYERRKKYFKDEMPEFERAAQDLNREEGLDVSVDQILDAFKIGKEVRLTKQLWSKLENTESCGIKKGEMNKVIDLAKKYNKQDPKELRKALSSGNYRRPLILKFGNRYHLVAGNTRLCTSAAMGIEPQVIIGVI